MNVKESIILAGGFGTRLQSIVPYLPKPMAPVGGRPFLEILINHLAKNKIEKVVLALGYRADCIKDFFTKNAPQGISVGYSIESEPLGTGGCVKKALSEIEGDEFIVINGDTFFDIDYRKLAECHERAGADVTIALKRLHDCSRYGSVVVDDSWKVAGFREKMNCTGCLINGGVYMASKRLLASLPVKFSFEKDLLEKHYDDMNFYGCQFDGYFVDIGIPEDYAKAQIELIGH